MSSSCPQCGWPEVAGARCPRCGVDVARYRADLDAASALPPPAAPVTAPRPAAPTSPVTSPTTSVGAPADAPVMAPMAASVVHPAGFWVRGVAILIDVVCVMAAEMAFGFFVWALAEERLATAAARAFRFLASPCYFVFLHWARGQTLGKMALRVRVVSLDGSPLSFGQAALRHLGAWFSAVILGIGYLIAAFRADKRALHDLIARTRVEHVS